MLLQYIILHYYIEFQHQSDRRQFQSMWMRQNTEKTDWICKTDKWVAYGFVCDNDFDKSSCEKWPGAVCLCTVGILFWKHAQPCLWCYIDVNFWSVFRYSLKMADPTFPRTIRNPPRWTGVQLLFQCSTLGRLFNKFDNRQVPLGC